MDEKNLNQGGEPYWGSVRFYKQLILAVMALLIIIPVGVCIWLAASNRDLRGKYSTANSLAVQQEKQIEQLKNEQDTLKQTAEQAEQAKQTAKEQADKASEAAKASVLGEDNIQPSGSWELILVNDNHTVPYDFDVTLAKLDSGQEVDARILPELNSMLQAASAEGVTLVVCAGYRDFEKQQNLFLDYVNKMLALGNSYKDAYYMSKMKVALPGKSDHHTGLCVDIIGPDCVSYEDLKPDSAEAVWLAKNSWKYGFIQRYPEGKTGVTGVEYEPYCYRYVGEEAAKEIMSEGITLEEYLSGRTFIVEQG